jgi:hypothetical protein
VAEVAEILKLNQQTVRNLIDRGELPAVHVGDASGSSARTSIDSWRPATRRLRRAQSSRRSREPSGTAKPRPRPGRRTLGHAGLSHSPVP